MESKRLELLRADLVNLHFVRMRAREVDGENGKKRVQIYKAYTDTGIFLDPISFFSFDFTFSTFFRLLKMALRKMEDGRNRCKNWIHHFRKVREKAKKREQMSLHNLFDCQFSHFTSRDNQYRNCFLVVLAIFLNCLFFSLVLSLSLFSSLVNFSLFILLPNEKCSTSWSWFESSNGFAV